MKCKLLFVVLNILIIVSCDNTKSVNIDGKYFMVGNKSQVLVISDSTMTFIDANGDPNTKHITSYINKKGDLVEVPSCEEIKYTIDSIDANNGIYVSAFKDEFRCYGYHLIKENQFLSVTPLKELDGIEFHFMSPTLYSLSKIPKVNKKEQTLTILITKDVQLNKINYVAFEQKLSETTEKSNDNQMLIKLDSGGINKSSIIINPLLYARNKYIAKYIDDSGNILNDIPVINRNILRNIEDKFTIEYQKKELQKLGINDLYLIAYRFNPGRKRVVNKIFGEEIQGQVQPFELRSLNKDYK